MPAEMVSKVSRSHTDKLFGGKTLEEYHKGFTKEHGQSSLACKGVVAELNILLKLQSKKEALDALIDACPQGENLIDSSVRRVLREARESYVKL